MFYTTKFPLCSKALLALTFWSQCMLPELKHREKIIKKSPEPATQRFNEDVQHPQAENKALILHLFSLRLPLMSQLSSLCTISNFIGSPEWWFIFCLKFGKKEDFMNLAEERLHLWPSPRHYDRTLHRFCLSSPALFSLSPGFNIQRCSPQTLSESNSDGIQILILIFFFLSLCLKVQDFLIGNRLNETFQMHNKLFVSSDVLHFVKWRVFSPFYFFL